MRARALLWLTMLQISQGKSFSFLEKLYSSWPARLCQSQGRKTMKQRQRGLRPALSADRLWLPLPLTSTVDFSVAVLVEGSRWRSRLDQPDKPYQSFYETSVGSARLARREGKTRETETRRLWARSSVTWKRPEQSGGVRGGQTHFGCHHTLCSGGRVTFPSSEK